MAQRFVLGLLVAIVAAGTAFFAMLVMDDLNSPAIIIEDAPSDVNIVIWVGGAVATPGIYKLPFDSRLNDAIAAAGGLSAAADVSSLNLAERIADEDRIEVPFVLAANAPVISGTPGSFGIRVVDSATQSDSDGAININTASETTLETLPRIGPALAARIIEFRTENGPFNAIEELARVDGISSTMVEEMRDLITVGS